MIKTDSSEKDTSKASQIFEGYKALGIVSNHVPFIIRYVQKLSGGLRIVTCVGRYFHVYDSKLRLLETSHAHVDNINILASDSINVFTASQNDIYVWKHGHRWLKQIFKGHTNQVQHLLPFGPHLISVDTESCVKVWEISKGEVTLEIPFSNASFKITVVFHPNTYVNKMLFCSEQGGLQLWNIRKQSLVYSYTGWESSITCVVQSPVCDVVAVGCADGKIIVHNLKTDESLMKFQQEWGKVLSLSFRTDDADKFPFLVSTTSLGHLAIWDLDRQELRAQMRDIHKGPITGCQFIEQEPLLVTSSSDNSIKIWCFDMVDSVIGRLLYNRNGHAAPPTKIRFHPSNGSFIISSGQDSTLKAFSVFTERLNRNLGVSVYNKNFYRKKKKTMNQERNIMSPISDFAIDDKREQDWDSIVACHRRQAVVTTWSYVKMKLGEHQLIPERLGGRFSKVFALCVSVSACGNYTLIGYSSGEIDKFNIQSGLHRCTFGKKTETAHNGSVQGVDSDALNQLAFSIGTDGYLKFWRFSSGQLLSTVHFNTSLSQLVFHRESALLAIANDDYSVHIVDAEMRRLVREFKDHQGRITDMTFSPDSRWLIVASMDCSIRVWDLSLGAVIDHFYVSAPCTSLTMSPSGEFLATTHSGDLGIYVWANASIYSLLMLKPIATKDFTPKLLDLPYVHIDPKEDREVDEEAESQLDNEQLELEHLPEPVASEDNQPGESEMVILSDLHSSRWQNLLNIDTIKKRNKPKAAVEKPKAAPFFLPVTSGLEPSLSIEPHATMVQTARPLVTFSAFAELLRECYNRSNYHEFLLRLKEMGPSALDAEIRSLSSFYDFAKNQSELEENTKDENLLVAFLEAISQALQHRRDFEFVHAVLGLFLQIHGDIILKDDELIGKCRSLATLIEFDWEKLRAYFSESLCIINYLNSIAMS